MIRLDDGVSSPVRISIPKAEPGDRVAVAGVRGTGSGDPGDDRR